MGVNSMGSIRGAVVLASTVIVLIIYYYTVVVSTSLVRASVVRGPFVVRSFEWLNFSSH